MNKMLLNTQELLLDRNRTLVLKNYLEKQLLSINTL